VTVQAVGEPTLNGESDVVGWGDARAPVLINSPAMKGNPQIGFRALILPIAFFPAKQPTADYRHPQRLQQKNVICRGDQIRSPLGVVGRRIWPGR